MAGKFQSSAANRKKADELGVEYTEETSDLELQKALDAATPYDNPQGVKKSPATYNPVGDAPDTAEKPSA